MNAKTLHQVVELLLRQARREGSVDAGDIRTELARANLPEGSWPEAVALAGPALVHREGRYYPADAPVSASAQRQQQIERTLNRLIRCYKASVACKERRHQNRVDFVQSVKVWTADGRELTLLSRDLSLTGVRLISSVGLLGQKIVVQLPGLHDREPHRFLVRVVWTCAVGDDLYENGGLILDLLPRKNSRLRLLNDE